MTIQRVCVTIAAVLFSATLLTAGNQQPTPKKLPPMSKNTRLMVIRSLNAELVFVRKPFPKGQKGLMLKNGEISPGEQEVRMLIAQYGMAAKPGDRARITDIEVKGDRIHFEINGGGKKKQKWYQHVEIGGMGGMTPVAPDTSNPHPQGSSIDLVFDKYVPELTGDQIRDMLAPVLDFHAKSAAEAFLDTVPPKVKEAIKDHRVLVGMNREMVTYSKGRPDQKIREKDDSGRDYEDWMYGKPPQQVDFVRFVGDEVVRVEEMKVDGSKVLRTEKEVDINPTGVAVAEKKPDQPKSPRKPPSLRRPGEQPEGGARPAGNVNPMPPDPTGSAPGPSTPQSPSQGPVGLPPS